MDLSINTRRLGGDDISWLGSARGTNEGRTVTLDTPKFLKSTHFPDGWFKSGIALAKGTDGKFVPFTGDDGTKLEGFLLSGVRAPANGTSPVGASLLDDARVVAANLPIPVSAAAQGTAPARFIFA